MNQRDDLFRHFLSACQVNDSCLDFECTSCGGKVFKSGLNLLGPRIVIQGLGSIGWDELTNSLGLIKPILAWVYSSGHVKGPEDFKSIEGSPVWRYFFGFEWMAKKRIVRTKRSRRFGAIFDAEYERLQRAEVASQGLLKAVVQKKIKLINEFLKRGGDPRYLVIPGLVTAMDLAQEIGEFVFKKTSLGQWVLEPVSKLVGAGEGVRR
jgi:hypothetical protein